MVTQKELFERIAQLIESRGFGELFGDDLGVMSDDNPNLQDLMTRVQEDCCQRIRTMRLNRK